MVTSHLESFLDSLSEGQKDLQVEEFNKGDLSDHSQAHGRYTDRNVGGFFQIINGKSDKRSNSVVGRNDLDEESVKPGHCLTRRSRQNFSSNLKEKDEHEEGYAADWSGYEDEDLHNGNNDSEQANHAVFEINSPTSKEIFDTPESNHLNDCDICQSSFCHCERGHTSDSSTSSSILTILDEKFDYTHL
jgi:hypothetical protein